MKKGASKEAKEAKAAAKEKQKEEDKKATLQTPPNIAEENKDDKEDEEDEISHFQKFDPTTQYMIRKTDYLLKQTQREILGDVSGSGANVAKGRSAP